LKVAINVTYGGFGLSEACYEWLIKTKGWKIGQDELIQLRTMSFSDNKYWSKHGDSKEFRINPDVIEAIETLGSETCSDTLARLLVVEIPDGVGFEIEEYDGLESIHEKHRSWP